MQTITTVKQGVHRAPEQAGFLASQSLHTLEHMSSSTSNGSISCPCLGPGRMAEQGPPPRPETGRRQGPRGQPSGHALHRDATARGGWLFEFDTRKHRKTAPTRQSGGYRAVRCEVTHSLMRGRLRPRPRASGHNCHSKNWSKYLRSNRCDDSGIDQVRSASSSRFGSPDRFSVLPGANVAGWAPATTTSRLVMPVLIGLCRNPGCQ